MADELEPTVDGEDTPEVEAHASERVLDLQGISIEDPAETGVLAASCSSCNGSLCS